MARLSMLIVILMLQSCGDGLAQEAGGGVKGSAGMSEKSGKPRFTNRLAKESSPYLRQHAHNPVDWFPWGDEAFAKAAKEDKPIFLSIGYSTCHWCHVMERESFEDEKVAAYLKEHFISIKVDREERPDVDNVYMAAVQAMTGSGGWPLTVFLTPDRRPFYGGTYFPPEEGFGRPSFMTVLRSIVDAWVNRRDDIMAGARKITDHIEARSNGVERAELTEKTLAKGFAMFNSRFDARNGGFETAPKFPRTHQLTFLLRTYHRTGQKRALEMVEKTLVEMHRGGIYDHLGGGFHRYSTDPVWLVPHFEKMLYDQALIGRACLEAYEVTKNGHYAAVARDIFKYVLRDMTDAKGGFHSAEDADAEGVEGKFQVWSLAEISEVLGQEDGAFFAGIYGATEAGNYREESTGADTRKNILHLPKSLAEVAAARDTTEAALEARLAPMRGKLFAVREKRVHPMKDDKVLTDWNALMISTLAYAGRVLGEERYTAAAARAADFLLTEMVDDGRLLHRYHRGDASIPAFLDDHAFLVFALLDLYETTFDARWLAAAVDTADSMLSLFTDHEDGGFLFAGAGNEDLFTETREIYDGAIPSGNSVAMLGLLRLGRITSEKRFEQAGRDTLNAFSGEIDGMPMGFPFALMALDFAAGPTREIVLAADARGPDLNELLAEVRGHYLPRAVLALNLTGPDGEQARSLIPYLSAQVPKDGKATAYVCENYACRAPVTTRVELAGLLRGRARITSQDGER